MCAPFLFNLKIIIMNDKKHAGPCRRRFRDAVDGPVVRRYYARMRTEELAQRRGLTVKQIENYVYRHSGEPWARKVPSLMSELNSEKGRCGGRPRKKVEK